MEREVRKVVTFGARRRWRRVVGLVIMELRLLGDEGGRLQVDAGGGDDVDDDGGDRGGIVDALVLLVLLVGGGDKGVVGGGAPKLRSFGWRCNIMRCIYELCLVF
uniref:Uncharacterized protein n=1 Tax=Fagus sylvatica TaxID=28930 RepID=A0A2N9GLD9_FAGSY